jgi:spermidine synthase
VPIDELVACELDPVVAKAARECFGVPAKDASGARMTVHVGDGLEYATSAAQ